jgi:NhaP-type Na+/H+ or K+/H+ antiporter
VTIQAAAILAAVVFGYGLFSAELARRWISGPLVFTAIGLAIGPWGFDLIGGEFGEGGVELLAEATLVLILFADATRIDLRVLRTQTTLPVRLLGIGLPLTVLAGTVIAVLLFAGDNISWWEAALIGAILAPTDAALGQAVVGNPRVPVRIRQALNVESGLNDGIMLPAVTILTALAAADAGVASSTPWARFVAEQVGFGVLVGVIVGGVGGAVLDYCVDRGWVDGIMRQLATLAVAVGAFGLAHELGGNGFVAAFVAGVAFGYVAHEHCESAADFTEDEGQLLALLTFLFFGALLLGPRIGELRLTVVLYAVLSMTVVRMVPVALSVIGVGLERPTIGYLGWFGPRGLASILFGLFVVEEAELAGAELILDVMAATVLLSIVAHGLTAVPFADRYADWFESAMGHDKDDSPMPEAKTVDEMRPRQGARQVPTE